MSALTLNRVGKAYPKFPSQFARLAELLSGRPQHTPVWALRDVSMRVPRGECIGIIGDNGAGKSTLLKLIAGTMQATEGEIERSGRVTAILELGAGFHPQFTGRQNIRFYAAALGYNNSQINALIPEVIAFSELGEAIDRTLNTYSSGMTVRLAFSVVTAVEPDILIVDEALAVGDQHFQRKCTQRIDEFRANGCSILLCSHSQYHIRQLCQRTLWLHNGRPASFGPTDEVLARYLAHVESKAQTAAEDLDKTPTPVPEQEKLKLKNCEIKAVDVTPLGAGDPPLLEGRDLAIRVEASTRDGETPNVGVLIENQQGVGITGVGTHADGADMRVTADDRREIVLHFPNLQLLSGSYSISVYLFDATGLMVYEEWRHCQRFEVCSADSAKGMMGIIALPRHWE